MLFTYIIDYETKNGQCRRLSELKADNESEAIRILNKTYPNPVILAIHESDDEFYQFTKKFKKLMSDSMRDYAYKSQSEEYRHRKHWHSFQEGYGSALDKVNALLREFGY